MLCSYDILFFYFILNYIYILYSLVINLFKIYNDYKI